MENNCKQRLVTKKKTTKKIPSLFEVLKISIENSFKLQSPKGLCDYERIFVV